MDHFYSHNLTTNKLTDMNYTVNIPKLEFINSKLTSFIYYIDNS